MSLARYLIFRSLIIVNGIIVVYFFATLIGQWVEPRRVIFQPKEFPQVSDSPDWYSQSYFLQRGDFYVGYNHIPADLQFSGNESITLSTPSDHTNLDNLETLVSHWQGPVSCALFVPGTDYDDALQIIRYLRECSPTKLIRQYVTFHFFFPREHIPHQALQKRAGEYVNDLSNFHCDAESAPEFGHEVPTYRKAEELVYPINVARNIARIMAQTHFVFPSDIELYPTSGFIPSFFHMLENPKNFEMHQKSRQVWVLPVFEVEKNVTSLPGNKKELKSLLDQKMAIPFHKFVCKICHNFPDIDKWAASFPSEGVLGSFEVVKRKGKQWAWEPFYVGTKLEPEFDERVTWEGRSNKRVQAFTLCLLDYDFHILDNAFLVHRPGIKKKAVLNKKLVKEMNSLLNDTIVPELKELYGRQKGCRI